MKNELITFTEDGTPVIDTVTIAKGVNVEHRAVIQLVRKYESDFNAFGRVTFEMRPFETAGGTQKREVALLNEDQATLLFTYLKNSEIARSLKIRVVKAFRDCRDELAKVNANPLAAMLAKPKSELFLELSQISKKNEELEAANQKLVEQAANDAPKVAFTDSVMSGDTEVTITVAAKTLGIGPRKFFNWLRMNGFLYKQSNQATQDAINSGLMVTVFAKIPHDDEPTDLKPYAHVTGKGLFYFYGRLLKEGLISKNDNLELAA